MDKLYNTGLSIEPWGTLLVTGLQLDPMLLIMTLWDLLFHLAAYSSSPRFLSLSVRML